MGLESFSSVQSGVSAKEVVERLQGASESWCSQGEPQLALLFASSDYLDEFETMLQDLREAFPETTITGCSGQAIIGGKHEYEDTPVVSILLLRHPELKVTTVHVIQEQVDESTGPGYWHLETGVEPEDTKGILVFADPFSMNTEVLLKELEGAYPEIPIVGGLASGDFSLRTTHLFENANLHKSGALLVFLSGPIKLETVVSQGCQPIGEPMVITKAEENVIHTIANQPALEVIVNILKSLDMQSQLRAQRNIFIGLVINEYQEEFHRGDFLVRNIIGADTHKGTITIGENVRVGQTIQFQMRDASAANEDMLALLQQAKSEIHGQPVKAALLCSCNGRGQGLFGKPDHDPATVAKILGDFPIAGFFCNGEIGPIGSGVFVHGYTCAVGLILDDSTPKE